jgi:hypothetical protein
VKEIDITRTSLTQLAIGSYDCIITRSSCVCAHSTATVDEEQCYHLVGSHGYRVDNFCSGELKI